MTDSYRVIGFLELVPDYAGFVDPVFFVDGTRYIQRTEPGNDTIASFVEISVGFAVELKTDEAVIERRVGDRRLFAFRFPDSSVVCGDRNSLGDYLRQRFFDLYTGRSAQLYPLLLVDVLSFLGDEQAIAEELDSNRSPSHYQKNLARNREHLALLNLCREDFRFASMAGQVHSPTRQRMLSVEEPVFRRQVSDGIRKLRTRRLGAVLVLLLVLAAQIFSGPLQEWSGLSSEYMVLGHQIAGSLAVLWLILELIATAGRLSRREAVDWVVFRLREATRKG